MLGSYSNLQDRDLVLRLIDGNTRAYCELYSRYKKKLLCFAFRFVKSQDIAEDIFHDTFILIWENRHFLDPNRSFSSYVFTIVKNRSLNILRNIKQNEKLRKLILSNALDYDEKTEKTVMLHELDDTLNKAISTLSPRQRQVFIMGRVEELSYKQIAEKLGISIYTVQEYMTLSIKNIKGFLASTYQSTVYILIFILTPLFNFFRYFS